MEERGIQDTRVPSSSRSSDLNQIQFPDPTRLHRHICKRLGLEADTPGLKRTNDGKYGVEYAECLASCGTGPVMMCNDDFYENVTNDGADEILEKYDE